MWVLSRTLGLIAWNGDSKASVVEPRPSDGANEELMNAVRAGDLKRVRTALDQGADPSHQSEVRVSHATVFDDSAPY